MTEYTQKLKILLSAKNIADAAFLLAIVVYLGCYLLLLLLEKELGFFEILAVLIYGLMATLVFSVLSIITRSIYLYKNPVARNLTQKILLFIATIPSLSFLLKWSGLL